MGWALGGATALGLGYVYGPRVYTAWTRPRTPPQGALTTDGTRTQAVIVLGADSPLGRALVLYLAERRLIVLASVASDEARHELERDVPSSSQGYVRVFCFDAGTANENDETQFIHALHSTLCLRFPLTQTGDPYSRPGATIDVLGMINVQSLARNVPQTALDSALHQHVTAPLRTLHRAFGLMTHAPHRMPSTHRPALFLSFISRSDAQVTRPDHGAEALIANAVQTGMDALRREWQASYVSTRTSHSKATPALRPITFTTLQVDTMAPTTSVLSTTANLLLSPPKTVARTYKLYSLSFWRRILSRLSDLGLLLLPTSWVDIIVTTNARFTRYQREASKRRPASKHDPPPPCLRPGSRSSIMAIVQCCSLGIRRRRRRRRLDRNTHQRIRHLSRTHR